MSRPRHFAHVAFAACLMPASLSATPRVHPACDRTFEVRAALAGSASARQSTFADVVRRPTDPASEFAYAPLSAERRCDASFCVHWLKQGPHAPADAGDGSIEALLAALGAARGELTASGHGYHGVDDGAEGGDARLDVYVAELPGMHGFAVPEAVVSSAPLRMSSFLLIDKDLVQAQLAADARAVIAHELKHTYDVAAFAAAPAWLFESAATWFEQQAEPESDGYADFLPCWFLYPEISLDAPRAESYPPMPKDHAGCTFDTTHLYGSSAFWFFTSGRFGAESSADVWKSGAELCPSTTLLDESEEQRACVAEAIDAGLKARGSSLGDELGALALEAMDLRESPSLSAALLPTALESWPEAAWAERPKTYPASGERKLPHLASRYFAFRAPEGRFGRVSLELEPSTGADVSLTTVQIFEDGSRQQSALPKSGKASFPGLGRSLRELWVVATNRALGAGGDATTLRYGATFSDLGKADAPPASAAPEASASESATASCQLGPRGTHTGGYAWIAAFVWLLSRRRR